MPKSGERRAAIVAGIIVPDHVAPVLERRYRDFVSTLEPSERLNGEPKGNRLCYKHRKAFAEMLGRFAMSVALTPFTLDLTDLTPEQAAPNAKIAESIREWIPQMKHDAPKDGLEHLARQVENLSVNQAHRLYCLANCFREAISAAVAFFSTGENEPSWESLSFEVDRTHPKPGNREEQAFTKIIGGWLWAWTETWPIPLIREIHTPDLLVMRKYAHGDVGLNVRQLLHGNVHWHDSATNWGIQVADMAASIIGEAIRRPTAYEAVRPNVKLMRACPYESFRGPGLIVGDKRNTEVLAWYRPLVEAVRAEHHRFYGH